MASDGKVQASNREGITDIYDVTSGGSRGGPPLSLTTPSEAKGPER